MSIEIVTVYIAGPMRGYPGYNFPAFYEAEKDLRRCGYTVINPARHDTESHPELDFENDCDLPDGFLEESMSWDIARIIESNCVVVLPGWEKSEGVAIELQVAKACGKPIMAYPDFDRIDWPPKSDEWRGASAPSATTQEVRVVDPQTGGAKGQKLARFDLVPFDVVWELAEHYGRGAQKYADRNWEKGIKWSLNFQALLRHLIAWWHGEDADAETGSNHLVAVLWHACALRWQQKHGKGTDDRPAD